MFACFLLTLIPANNGFVLAQQDAPLSSDQISRLASQKASAAELMVRDARSRTFTAKLHNQETANQLLAPLQSSVAFRLRQNASASALKLHYAIAACLMAESVLDDTDGNLSFQEKAQAQLVDRGIPIPDPLLIDRLKKTSEDKRIENQSKLHLLRTQLAALIGPECACQHSPRESDEIVPSDIEVCERVRQALHCRCDLLTLKRLSNSINEDTLEAWDSMAAILSGVPTVSTRSSLITHWLRSKCMSDEIQSAIQSRKQWLNALIEERSKQIGTEVEVAFEKKKSSALRWVNAREQMELWDRRLTQLEEMGRVRGNLVDQFEAKMNRLQASAVVIERWLDWQLANVELNLAIGCP
jgi:hypothetical protein